MSSSSIADQPHFRQLKSIRRRRLCAATLGTLLLALTAGVACLTIASAIEAVFSLGVFGRSILWLATPVIVVVASIKTFHSAVRGGIALSRIAEDVERAYPEFRERLIAGREFSTGTVHGSHALAEAVIREAGEILNRVDVRTLVDWKHPARSGIYLAASLAISGAVYLLHPGDIASAFTRLSTPMTSYQTVPDIRLSVDPGDTRIARGDTLTVAIQLDGSHAGRLTVYHRESGAANWLRESVTVSGSGTARWQWPHVRANAEYRVDAGQIASPVYHVTVVERPQVTLLKAQLDYPEYTRREPTHLPANEGHISAIVGTRVSLTVTPNKPVSEGFLVFSNGDSVKLFNNGRTASGHFNVRNSSSYHISLADEYGYRNINPIVYGVEAIPDEYPSVRITHPDRVADLDQDMRVLLRAEMLDDFGFDRLELHAVGPNGDRIKKALPITRTGPGHAESQYVWDVGEMDLLPEDRIRYRVAVWDNDRVSGPKRTESHEHVLRFPSIAEIFAETQSSQREQIGGLSEVQRQGREVRDRLEAIRREVLKTEDLSWESRQESERIAEQQEQMNREVDRIASELQQTLEQLERNNVISHETLEKVAQIQELMKALVPPELMHAIEEMRKRTQEMADPRAVERAMADLGEKQDEFNRNLDRILDLLRDAQADQQLEAMQRRLKELEHVQRKVAERLPEDDPRSIAARERGMSAQVEDARKQIESMAKEMNDLTDSPSDSLQAIADGLRNDRVSERLDQLAEDVMQGSRTTDASQREALDIADAIKRASDRMQQAIEDRRGRRTYDIADRIDRAATDLLRLSTMQEDLLHASGKATTRSVQQTLGETQVEIQIGTSQVTSRVMQVARETSHIPPDALRGLGESIRSMTYATRAIDEQQGPLAVRHQRSAMGALNQTVAILREAGSSAQQSGSGSSLQQLLQQLTQMAEQQQRLNDAIQQMSGEGELSASDMELLAQMAAQQRAMAEAMRRIAEELRQFREVLGRLDDLAGEMDESAHDMESVALGERLQDRQQRILRRLLDAQRSLSVGKQGTERTAEASRDAFEPIGPGQLPSDLGQRRDFIREAMIEALQADYPAEYRRWIRNYYEHLLKEHEDQSSESR